MDSSDAKAAAIIGGAAILGGAAYYFATQTPASNAQIASIDIADSSDSVEVGQQDTLTATAYDSASNPVAGAKIGFYSDGQFLGYANTDSSGVASFNASFASPGTYQVYAEG